MKRNIIHSVHPGYLKLEFYNQYSFPIKLYNACKIDPIENHFPDVKMTTADKMWFLQTHCTGS